MYNVIIKQEFLDTLERSGNYKVLFNSFGVYENLIGKDLALMSRSEIANGLGTMGYVTYAVVENVISMIKQYLLWYADNNNGTIPLEVFKLNWNDVDISDSIRSKMICDENEIVNEFTKFKPEDGHMIQVVYLFAFHGVSPNILCKLKDTDVVCKDGCVHMNTNHSISEIYSDALYDAVLNYKSWSVGESKLVYGLQTVRRDEHGMFLYRRIPDSDLEEHAPVDVAYITSRFYQIKKRIADGHDFRFDIGDVKLSGQYLRMCMYYNNHGEWPDVNEMRNILGKKCRDGFDRNRMIGGARLYKEIFNL